MGPNREACDRCHAMKTRCVRASQSDMCLRCGRLGVSCDYSPPGQSGRPAGSRRSKRRSNDTTKAVRVTSDELAIDPAIIQGSHVSDRTRNEHAVVGFENMDIFNDQTCRDDDDIVNSFIQTLDSNESESTAVFSTSMSSPEASRYSATTDQSLRATNAIDFDARRSEETGVGDEEDRLDTIIDIQARLASLLKSLSSGGNVIGLVEDAYRVSEAFTGTIDCAESEPSDFLGDSKGFSAKGPLLLLSSSCYLSLIQVFDLLANLLCEEMCHSNAPRSTANDLTANKTRKDGTNDNSRCRMPSISVGAVRLAMPTPVAAQMNLQLIVRMAQNVGVSMQRLVAKEPPSLLTRHADFRSRKGTSFDLGVRGSDTILRLAEIAQLELRQNEESLSSLSRMNMYPV